MTNNKKYNSFITLDSNIFDISEERVSSGNLGSTVIIPHVCNNINLFGAGFAAAVASRYPEVKENFHMLGNKAKLGNVQFVTIKNNKQHRRNLIFANMIAQNRVIDKNNPRPLNYASLVNCMTTVRDFAKNLLDTEHDKVEIHCPRFGCGLAGGNWNFISELIKDIWSDFDIFIYILKTNNTRINR